MPPKDSGKADKALARGPGFVPLRRGLVEHIQDGRMTHGELTAFVWILMKANPSNGVWQANAPILAADLQRSGDYAKRALTSLRAKGYIHYEASSRGRYPVMVLKYKTVTGRVTGVNNYPQDGEKS